MCYSFILSVEDIQTLAGLVLGLDVPVEGGGEEEALAVGAVHPGQGGLGRARQGHVGGGPGGLAGGPQAPGGGGGGGGGGGEGVVGIPGHPGGHGSPSRCRCRVLRSGNRLES